MSERKRWIAKVRRKWGKKNGVIPSFAFDDLRYFKLERAYRNKLLRTAPSADA